MTLQAEIIDEMFYVSEDQVDRRLQFLAKAGDTQVSCFADLDEVRRLHRTLGTWIEGEERAKRVREPGR